MSEPKILTADDVTELEKGWGLIKRYPNGSVKVRDRDMAGDVADLVATVRSMAKPKRAAAPKPALATRDDEPTAEAKPKAKRKRSPKSSKR